MPADLDITPSGDSLVIALYGKRALGIVDLGQAALALTTTPLQGLDSARSQSAIHVRVLANGHAMLGTRGSDASAWTIVDADLANGTQRERSDIVGGVGSETHMERSFDGRVLIADEDAATCMRRYEVRVTRSPAA